MTTTPSKPNVTFAEYVERHSTKPSELPLVHTTECQHLNSILATNTIEPRPCSIFGEPLIYFFYGRPAYRDAAKTTPIKDVSFCPVCFIFRPQTKFAITRVYPFDSGASQNGFYEPEVHGSMALATYAVQAVVESARRIIDGFFETNEDYLGCKATPGLLFGPNEIDAEAFYKLITGGGHPDCDDRRSAVEIQISQPAKLCEDLLAVALPTSFLDDSALRKALLEVWRAHPLTYDADIGMRPTEFHGEIRRIIREYYRHWKFL
jgi:hypothetical protein